MADPAIVGGYFREVGTTTGTVENFTVNPDPGDVMWLGIITEDSTTVTATATGYTLAETVVDTTGGDMRFFRLKRVADGSETSFTFALSASCYTSVGLIVVRGGDEDPYTTASLKRDSPSMTNARRMPGFTTTHANTLAIGWSVGYETGPTTAVSNWSEPTGSTAFNFYRTVASASTIATETIGGSATRWVGHAILLADTGGGGDVRAVTGSLSLALAASSTATKAAGTAGSLSLGLAVGDDASKTGAAVGGLAVSLAVAAAAAKIVDALGAVALSLTLDGAASATEDDVRNVAGVLALALELDGDAAKLASVAGSLGLTLDMLGAVDAVGDNETSGAIALALAIVATAVKAADAAGAIGVALDLAGTASKATATAGDIGVALGLVGDADVPAPGETVGALGLELGLAATGTKAVDTVGTLSLVLSIAAAVYDIGLVPSLLRTVVVRPERRQLVVVAEDRTVTASALRRTLVPEGAP